MSDLRESLKTEFQEPEYRYGYAESFLNTKLATQIKTLREQRDYTQEEVAALMDIKQPGYRRFEDVNHSVWKTDSLWNIARAYGVRLDINFKTFGSLLDEKEHFTKEVLRVPAFEDDPAFKESAVKEPESEDVLAPVAVVNPGTVAHTHGLGLEEEEGLEQVRAIGAAMGQSVLKCLAGANTGKGLIADFMQWNTPLRFGNEALVNFATGMTLKELAEVKPTTQNLATTLPAPPSGVIEITVKNYTAPGDGQEKTSKYTKPLESIRRVSFKKGEEYGHRPNHARRKPA